MALLTVLLLAGSAVRLAVLVLRPTARQRFRQARRRVLAKRLEQLGDLVVIVTALWMIGFGYGGHPGAGVVTFWALVLLGGFTVALLAHYLAGRHRLEPPPRPPARRSGNSRSSR